MKNLGVKPSPYDYRDYAVKAIIPEISLPATVRHDHKIKKVLDQGFCGTCVGKGTNAIMSAHYNQNFSSLFIYTLCKERDGFPNEEGTFPRIAMKVITQEGTCLDQTLPYSTLNTCTLLPSITGKMLVEAANYTAKEYARAWNLYDIKSGIAANCLVGATFYIGYNWIYYKEGVIQESPRLDAIGLHWVALCGYDDNIQAVRGVNSWGTSWGEGGFFWVPYSAFQENKSCAEAWVVKFEETKKVKCLDKIRRIILRYKR